MALISNSRDAKLVDVTFQRLDACGTGPDKGLGGRYELKTTYEHETADEYRTIDVISTFWIQDKHMPRITLTTSTPYKLLNEAEYDGVTFANTAVHERITKKEPIEMTMEQIEKKLGYPIKIVKG